MSNPCGDNIFFDTGKWEFNEQVTNMFPIHVRKSIPGYLNVHEMVADLIQVSSMEHDSLRILDLGCSIGELEGRVSCKSKSNFKLFAIDNSESMIRRCKYNVRDDRIVFIQNEMLNYLSTVENYEAKFDIIVCLYTLQFLEEQDQYRAIDKIAGLLNPGGMFIFADKFLSRDPQIDAIKEANLLAYKIKQGFTPEETNGKLLALKGVQHRIKYPLEFLSRYFEREEVLDTSLNFICSVFYKR